MSHGYAQARRAEAPASTRHVEEFEVQAAYPMLKP